MQNGPPECCPRKNGASPPKTRTQTRTETHTPARKRETPVPRARGFLGVSLGVRRNHVQKPGLRLPCPCKI